MAHRLRQPEEEIAVPFRTRDRARDSAQGAVSASVVFEPVVKRLNDISLAFVVSN